MKKKIFTVMFVGTVLTLTLYCTSVSAATGWFNDAVRGASENPGGKAVNDTADNLRTGAQEKIQQDMNKDDSAGEEEHDRQIQEQEHEASQEEEHKNAETNE